MRLHVLLPYWGDPDLLDQAVASVLAQTDPRWRLTIVDDGYPDDRPRERYADHPDARVEYLRNETNLGVAGNFERCRQLVAEPLAVFMGSDDLMDPAYVATVLGLRERFPDAAILQPGVRVVDEHGEPSATLTERVKALLTPRTPRPFALAGEELAASLLRGNWLYWPSLVFDAEYLARHTFRADLPIILDLALILDVVLDGGALVVDDAVCFSYRRHPASASSTSLLGGSRFADERRFYRESAQRLAARGWPRAAGVARRRVVSRLHAATMLPAALRARSGAGRVARHVLSR